MDKNEVVIENKDIKIKDDATLIFSFANMGLIGPIIGHTLIEQIDDMKEIGFVVSEELPPIAVFYEGVLEHPFRLFYSEKENIILGLCEVPFQSTSAYDGLSSALCNWAIHDGKRVKEILIFQGIPKRGEIEEFNVYFAAEEEKTKFLEEHNIQRLKRGILTGPEATILNRALTHKVNAYALFTEVQQYPTPEGAAAIIDKLNELYGLNIDTEKLLEQGREIKKKLQEMAEKAQQYQRKQLQDSSQGAGYPQYYK